MLKPRSTCWTLLLGIALAVSLPAMPRTAQAQATQAAHSATESGKKKHATESSQGRRHDKRRRSMQERRERRVQSKANRLSKRRTRLEGAAEKMRNRAAKLRERAASQTTPKKSNRPDAVPLTPETMLERAVKFEKKAAELDARAKETADPKKFGLKGKKAKRRHAARQHASGKARREYLRKRWGRRLKHKSAKLELTTHARRIAKLKRIRSLAQAAKDFETARRATKLLVREQARHHKSMDALPPATGKTATPTPTTQK